MATASPPASLPRPALSLRVRLYVAATVAVALLLLPLSRLSPGTRSGSIAILEALVLAALNIGAQRRPVHLGARRKVTAGTAVEVAAVLLLPGPIAVLTLVAAAVAGGMQTPARTAQRLFNAAVAALRAIVGTATYATLLQWLPAPLAEPAAACAAATVMYVCTTALVQGIAAVQLRTNPLQRASLPSRDLLLIEAALSLCGVLTAQAAAHHAWTLPLVIVPGYIGSRALRDRAALQQELAQRRQAEAALQASEGRLQALVQHVSDVIASIDIDGRMRYISPSVQFILGYEPHLLLGEQLATIVHPDDCSQLQQVLGDVQHRPELTRRMELRQRCFDGSWRYFEATATNLLDQPGVQGILITAHDITDRKQFEAQLIQQAFHDPLTELPNRALFMDRLAHALAGMGRQRLGVAVLFLDLDGFKAINDTRGHRAGDEVLVALARRLSACLRPADTLARFGGDEFAVLVPDAENAHEAMQIADRLIAAAARTFVIEGEAVGATVSIGVALGLPLAAPLWPDVLLQQADMALYRAKAAGKGRAVVFEPGMNVHGIDRFQRESELRSAVEREEFTLHYQPIVDLVTGAVDSVEALLRWQHPQQGLIPPAGFIELAERSGLILPLGRWVLAEACRQARAWHEDPGLAGGSPVVSVNLSLRQLSEPDLAAQVRSVLIETGLEPEALQLEITESVLLDDSEALATAHQLRALGVQLAIDDFGTGYSSLSYLRRLPVDVVKVDRTFVRHLPHDAGTRAIVYAVCELAHHLGMTVTAEGIETVAELEAVRALECDRAQGYYYAKPLPPSELTSYLRSDVRRGRPSVQGVG